jgi:hypothetical protein
MKQLLSPRNQTGARVLPTLLALALLGFSLAANAGQKSASKWQVFEETFRSTRLYANPVQEARLTVAFVSPSGQTNRVHGFWDGGSKWGVRFRPDALGYWTYTTECSDARNSGLHGKSGRFLCTVQSLRTRLDQHGPVEVPLGTATFQHADGTPFFWLSDNVSEGARNSTRTEWAQYVHLRATQGFNAAFWQAAPGTDDRNRSAFKGTDTLVLNTGFLNNLDEKTIRLNDSDMVSAIAPLWEIGIADEDLLPESQVIVLLRQMVARWDAYHVTWVIAFEADTAGRRAARWRRIGRSVFDQVNHSPVIVFCGATQWALKDFANETWVDAGAFQSGNDVSTGASLWLAKGPASALWQQEPVRPVLNLLPGMEAGFTPEGQAINSPQTIESLARSLFVAPPAGLCYQTRAVAQWDETVDPSTLTAAGMEMAGWQKSLYLPGASRAAQIKDLLARNEFYRLTPADSILLPAANDDSNPAPFSALAAHARKLALIYLPEGRTAHLAAQGLRGELSGRFLSLQTGETVSVDPNADDPAKGFTAPGPGDWLLLLAPEVK